MTRDEMRLGLRTVNTNVENNVQSDHLDKKNLLTFKSLAIALVFVLFAVFVVLAFPNALTRSASDPECLTGSVDCTAGSLKQPNFIVWGGVYLCSLVGLILMTFKSNGEKRAASTYVTLASAAALNTLMWMAFVYAGAFLLNLF